MKYGKRCDQILLNVTLHSAGEAMPAQDLSTAIAARAVPLLCCLSHSWPGAQGALPLTSCPCACTSLAVNREMHSRGGRHWGLEVLSSMLLLCLARGVAQALRLLLRAVAQGETYAQHYSRFLFEDGVGVAKGRSKAIRFYRLAAGQSPGTFLLALVGLDCQA